MTERFVASDGHALVRQAIKCMCTRRMGVNQHELVTFTDDLHMKARDRWSVNYNGVGGITTDVENLTVWRKRIGLFIFISIGADFERGAIGLIGKLATAFDGCKLGACFLLRGLHYV